MKKIVILGSNSYIARNLNCYLSKTSKFDIKLFDFQEKSLDDASNYEQINVFDLDSIRKIDFDVDIIFFFVGKTGALSSFANCEQCLDINEKALLNVLTIMVEKSSKAKFVFPSTRLVYKGHPGKIKEDDPKEFKTIYGVNKYACEQYLSAFNNLYGLNYLILRICVPYGTLVKNAKSYGTADFFINKAINKEDLLLFGDGQQRRTFTHIADLCEVMVNSSLNEKCLNDVYNVGGDDKSLVELADMLSTKYNVGVQFKEWSKADLKIETGDTVFDSNKLDFLIKKEKYITLQEWMEGK